MWLLRIVILTSSCLMAKCEIEYNTINEDGSYQFRHTNDDIGGYYHSASGTPDNVVRGRYGSRNPTTGQVEETVYSAGPRGFRVNSPTSFRQMDLAQYPPRPVGSPDDPLADPFDVPTYRFSFATGDQSRSENTDAAGRVRGLYSFVDDEGELHSVRYAAGAGTGFEVTNVVPDNPITVGYANPLYKAPPSTRGKMAVQRGPDGTYKLIAAGPDHRRAESRTPDGLVRGTYSFLDDKGVQRTVEYIAGAGIGYRVVQNRVGPSSHINPTVSDFRLQDSNFKLANDFGTSAGPSPPLSAGSSWNRGGGDNGGGGSDYETSGTGKVPSRKGQPDEDGDADNDIEEGGSDKYNGDNGRVNTKVKSDRMSMGGRGRGGTRYQGGSRPGGDREQMSDRDSPRVQIRPGSRNPGNRSGEKRGNQGGRGTGGNRGGGGGGGGSGIGGGGSINGNGIDGRTGYDYLPPKGGPPSKSNYEPGDDDIGTSLPPLITSNRKLLQIERDREWGERHRDSTLIKNVGKWYINLPPGHSVRAHVQNIDILPLGGRRVLSPSEALRQDELADMEAAVVEGGGDHNRYNLS